MKLLEFVENNFGLSLQLLLWGKVQIKFGESCHGVENKSGHLVSLYLFIL